MATSGLLVVAALFWRRREHGAASTVDFALAGLTFTLASPVAWEHHFGILAPIFALTFPLFRAHRPLGRVTLPLLLLTLVVAGGSIPAARLLAPSMMVVLLQSQLFLGAICLLALLFRLRGAIAAPAKPRAKVAASVPEAATISGAFEPRLVESGGWD